jgi:phosphoenolpyruvate-protein kinase (PTS system EI component)
VGSWAPRVDFFSLGTNDLLASALGIDRDDPVGARSNDILHPGLIRMIAEIISAAHQAGKPVCVCGEMASDLRGAIALTALGADSLSLAVDQVAAVRKLLAGLDPESLPSLRSQLVEASTADGIKKLLQSAITSSNHLVRSPC